MPHYCSHCKRNTQSHSPRMMRGKDGAPYLHARCIHCNSGKAIKGKGFMDFLNGVGDFFKNKVAPVASAVLPFVRPLASTAVASRFGPAAGMTANTLLGGGMRRHHTVAGRSFLPSGYGMKRRTHHRR